VKTEDRDTVMGSRDLVLSQTTELKLKIDYTTVSTG